MPETGQQSDSKQGGPINPPPTAGLPPRDPSKPLPDAPPARTGNDLLDAAAAGDPLQPKENVDLVEYFLSNNGLPGDDEVTKIDVRVGRGRAAKVAVWEIHSISWDEWQDARDNGTDDKTGKFDAYVAASWNVARALTFPALGPAVRAAQAADPEHAPKHAAELLQRMFDKQSGTLLEASAKVLEISHLQDDDGSVTETDVEAAKN